MLRLRGWQSAGMLNDLGSTCGCQRVSLDVQCGVISPSMLVQLPCPLSQVPSYLGDV